MMSDEKDPVIYKRDAMTLACNVTQQFITIAIGGIAFMVGTSFSSPVSPLVFWLTLMVFGSSVLAGLWLLGYVVGCMNKGRYDAYAPAFRLLAIVQMFLAVVGIVLLCGTLQANKTNTVIDSNMNLIEFSFGSDDAIVRCPFESGRKYSIECDNGKINVTTQPITQAD